MKKTLALLLLVPLFLLTGCREKAEIEEYKFKINLVYDGVENKVFHYQITNDPEKACKVASGVTFRNGDQAAVQCRTKTGASFQKNFLIDRLYSDDLEDPKVSDALLSFAKERYHSEFTFAMPTRWINDPVSSKGESSGEGEKPVGISLSVSYPADDGIYDSDFYDHLFVKPNGQVIQLPYVEDGEWGIIMTDSNIIPTAHSQRSREQSPEDSKKQILDSFSYIESLGWTALEEYKK